MAGLDPRRERDGPVEIPEPSFFVLAEDQFGTSHDLDGARDLLSVHGGRHLGHRGFTSFKGQGGKFDLEGRILDADRSASSDEDQQGQEKEAHRTPLGKRKKVER
jgi:hypothetical protein